MKNIVNIYKNSHGVRPTPQGAEVTVWSPEARMIELMIADKAIALQRDELGYWRASGVPLRPGDLYQFRINEDKTYPDPASLSQPQGVHGPSQPVDLGQMKWTDQDWKNIQLEKYIFYELHIGTFTLEGNFDALEKKLDHLVNLGITAIELMPLAQFAGNRNWGYDGVFPYAVHHAYGGPYGLQRFVDACHARGLAVVLDVVYNHLGPEGNYLTAYGPYITEKYKTPWGGAINFDDAWCYGVRQYFIENALMWFRDFHIDALRLDAVHAIRDFGPKHLLQELREATDALMAATGRTHYLIVESDLNDKRFIEPLEQNGYGMDAQWIDEFHHALRTAAGGERTGYYSDFDGLAHLAKAYEDAYVYDGQYSPHRKKFFGVPTSNPGKQFVVFSQNHDQVGNRMLGERSSQLHSFEMQKLMAAAVLLSPYLPMLFMGEEWSEPSPFLYFVSHTDPVLAEAVRKGRKEEFAAFHAQGEAPDPIDEGTFEGSRLQWHLKEKDHHQVMLQYYRTLIALRKSQPALATLDRKSLHVDHDANNETLALYRWTDAQQLVCLMNFSEKIRSFNPPPHIRGWQKLLDSAAPEWLGRQAAPEAVSGGQPGSASVVLQPASVVVYGEKLANT